MKLIYIFTPLFFASGMTVYSQVDQKLRSYNQDARPEKVFVHTDRSAYLPGDTVWFKAYVTQDNLPTGLSKNLFLDFFNDKGKSVGRILSPIVMGGAAGQFVIPEDFKGKALLVKSFTKWMTNFGTGTEVSTLIPILQKYLPDVDNNAASIQFYPEGGSMVANTSNNIAYKFADAFLGKNLSGKFTLIDDLNNNLKEFPVASAGIGKFDLTPDAERSYFIIYKSGENKAQTFSLPKPVKDGVVLNLEVQQQSREFLIRLPKGSGWENKELEIVGSMEGLPVFNINTIAKDGKISGSIPVSSLPYGIMNIAVFGNTGEVLAQRNTLIFDEARHILKPEVKVSDLHSEKGLYRLTELSGFDEPVNISVSVLNSSQVKEEPTNIILSGLVPSISDPYLKNKNEQKLFMENLSNPGITDLIVLTSNTPMPDWKSVLNENNRVLNFKEPDQYFTLRGYIKGYKPSGDNTILLGLGSSNESLPPQILPVDINGNFRLDNFMIFDSLNAYYKIMNPKLKNNEVVFFQEEKSALELTKTELGLLREYSAYKNSGTLNPVYDLAINRRVKMLKEVKLKSSTKTQQQLLDDKYTSGFFRNPGVVFDVMNERIAPAYMSIFAYLSSKFPAYHYEYGYGKTTFKSLSKGEPIFYLNEFQVSAETISTVPVHDIAIIKYISDAWMGIRYGASSGVIAVYLKRGSDYGTNEYSEMIRKEVAGYDPIRFFQVQDPDSPYYEAYSNNPTKYWAPGLIIDKGNTYLIRIPGNKEEKAARMVIQGISESGKLIFTTKDL